jgi:UDP-N-acetylmuramate dehydrogenase
MITSSFVPLKTLTTLHVGGAAHRLALCESVDDVKEALALARSEKLPFYILGEGSNILAPDAGYKGVVIKVLIPGFVFEDAGNGTTLVNVGAGVSWDLLVSEAANRGLWGLENLAGIPGFVGAAPVQNIGAYGAELKDTLVQVDVIDARTGEEKRLTKSECELSYRDSRFKHDQNLIITNVTLALMQNGSPKIEYGDLLRAQEKGVDLSTPSAIAAAVRTIRSAKFPDRTQFGTAGSFFKNPILSEAAYDELSHKYGPVPRFPNPNGIKIPLAFVLDKILDLRGYRKGKVWLFGAQPLVLVVDEGGTAEEVNALANEITERVREIIGVSIEREVRTMPEE